MPRKPAVHDVVTLDELMTANDVADVLGLSTGTLANWRSLNMGPDYVKVGGRVRYRVSGINEWVARQEHKAPSDPRRPAPRQRTSSRAIKGGHMSRAIQKRTPLPTPVRLEDAQNVGTLLAGSRSAETRRSYASAMRTFTAWCQERGYPAVPTGPEVVASYIAHRSTYVAHSTISRDVAAISAAHLDTGLDDPTAHHGVRQALRSVGRTLGTAPSRRATPLTTILMRQIIDAMEDLETATGKRDRAILLLGLAAAQRRSEIAALTTNDIARQDAGLLLRIRRSKTDQTGRGDLIGIPFGAHPETCPVLALEAWLEASGRRLGDGTPVFSRIYNHSRIANAALSDRSIARIIQARAAAAGISGKDYAHTAGVAQTWVSGHSLRAGHATSAAAAGVDPMTISRTTRHRRLDSLARYVRPASALEDSTAGKIGL